MATNYAYHYAIVRESDGWCLEAQDTSTYILDPTFVPIENIDTFTNYLKYYWPLPEVVNSFDDFQGTWWNDAAHTDPVV